MELETAARLQGALEATTRVWTFFKGPQISENKNSLELIWR